MISLVCGVSVRVSCRFQHRCCAWWLQGPPALLGRGWAKSASGQHLVRLCLWFGHCPPCQLGRTSYCTSALKILTLRRWSWCFQHYTLSPVLCFRRAISASRPLGPDGIRSWYCVLASNRPFSMPWKALATCSSVVSSATVMHTGRHQLRLLMPWSRPWPVKKACRPLSQTAVNGRFAKS